MSLDFFKHFEKLSKSRLIEGAVMVRRIYPTNWFWSRILQIICVIFYCSQLNFFRIQRWKNWPPHFGDSLTKRFFYISCEKTSAIYFFFYFRFLHQNIVIFRLKSIMNVLKKLYWTINSVKVNVVWCSNDFVR